MGDKVQLQEQDSLSIQSIKSGLWHSSQFKSWKTVAIMSFVIYIQLSNKCSKSNKWIAHFYIYQSSVLEISLDVKRVCIDLMHYTENSTHLFSVENIG